MKLPSATEHQIQTQIINYLRINGYYVMRLNSGKYAVGEGRDRRFVMGQDAGTPDLMAFKALEIPILGKHIPEGIDAVINKIAVSTIFVLFIEVKRPGKKATSLQEVKMRELTDYGARCIVATSVEDLKEKLYGKHE